MIQYSRPRKLQLQYQKMLVHLKSIGISQVTNSPAAEGNLGAGPRGGGSGGGGGEYDGRRG